MKMLLRAEGEAISRTRFDAFKLEGFYCYILTGFIAVNPNT